MPKTDVSNTLGPRLVEPMSRRHMAGGASEQPPDRDGYARGERLRGIAGGWRAASDRVEERVLVRGRNVDGDLVTVADP